MTHALEIAILGFLFGIGCFISIPILIRWFQEGKNCVPRSLTDRTKKIYINYEMRSLLIRIIYDYSKTSPTATEFDFSSIRSERAKKLLTQPVREELDWFMKRSNEIYNDQLNRMKGIEKTTREQKIWTEEDIQNFYEDQTSLLKKRISDRKYSFGVHVIDKYFEVVRSTEDI